MAAINREDFDAFLHEFGVAQELKPLVLSAWKAALASAEKDAMHDDYIDVVIEKYGLDNDAAKRMLDDLQLAEELSPAKELEEA